jgi:hypothetical protein
MNSRKLEAFFNNPAGSKAFEEDLQQRSFV